jgi:low temperature requirement protein LtrA
MFLRTPLLHNRTMEMRVYLALFLGQNAITLIALIAAAAATLRPQPRAITIACGVVATVSMFLLWFTIIIG